MCRTGFVETIRAIALAGGRKAVKGVEADWLSFDVIEVDRSLTEHAAELALSTESRSGVLGGLNSRRSVSRLPRKFQRRDLFPPQMANVCGV